MFLLKKDGYLKNFLININFAFFEHLKSVINFDFVVDFIKSITKIFDDC